MKFDPHAEAEGRGISIPEMARRGGRKAHQILDWCRSPRDGIIYVKTRRFDWHRATERERKLLNRSVYVG